MKVWLPVIRAGSGADVFVQRLATGLRRRDIQAEVTWLPHASEFVPDLLRTIRPPGGVDVIHANSTYAFAFRRTGIPLVATELHYVLDPAFRPYKSAAQHAYHRLLLGAYMRRSYAQADAVTAISEFTASVLRDVAGVPRVRSIPLWLEPGVFKPGPPRVLPSERFRLLFVGNASRRKGADVIAPLAALLGPGFEIACTAGLRERMPGRMPDNVTILGRLDLPGLVAEYQAADAVLVPSRYEGFGYAALEAMTSAKPVVGFASGAIREVVREEETALLADIDDLDGLARQCRRLASDPALRRRLGEAGAARAAAVYGEEAGVGAYVSLYQSLRRSG